MRFLARTMRVVLLLSVSRGVLEKKHPLDTQNLVMKVSGSCRIWKKAVILHSKQEFSYWHWQNHSYLKRKGIYLFLICFLEMVTLLLGSLSRSLPHQWRMWLCIIVTVLILCFLLFEVHLVFHFFNYLLTPPFLLNFGTNRSPRQLLGFLRLLINISCWIRYGRIWNGNEINCSWE